MSRILRIELRRSVALGTALVVLASGTLMIRVVGGVASATDWAQLTIAQRWYLVALIPLALVAGAWQGRREYVSKAAELFSSTPRPAAHRKLPVLAAMAIAVVAAYVCVGVVKGAWIVGAGVSLPTAYFIVTGVGVLDVLSAAWLGLAAGRLLPSRATAPALALISLADMVPVTDLIRRGWQALVFSPGAELSMPDPHAAAPGLLSAAQAVWAATLAVAAVILDLAPTKRLRLAALLPVALFGPIALVLVTAVRR